MIQTAMNAGRQTFAKSAPVSTNVDRSLEVVVTTLCLASAVVYGSLLWVFAQMVRWAVSWIGPVLL